MIEYAGITGGKELSEGPFVVSLDRLCCRAHFVVRMRFANFIHEVLGDGGSACRDDVKLDRVRSFKEVTKRTAGLLGSSGCYGGSGEWIVLKVMVFVVRATPLIS